MIVFVYECLTGGGLLGQPQAGLPSSLAREGAAMATALARDFAALPRCQVRLLRDSRCSSRAAEFADAIAVGTPEEHDRAFDRMAAEADWTVVIAPETGGRLSTCCRHVLCVGGRLLGPSPEITDLAGDKQSTAEHLAAHGVPAPLGVLINADSELPGDLGFPAVLKPRDGAGSLGVRLVGSRAELRKMALDGSGVERLETYHPGMPVSVACLCGSDVCVPLAACRQLLSDDGTFNYLGGALPLAEALAHRARRLATRAIQSLDAPRGYLGVDIILGDEPDGRDDVVIEINPRLTTSYVGLRAAANENLAEAMLAAAEGEPPTVTFRGEPLRFDPEGNVWSDASGDSRLSTTAIESTT